MDNISNFINLIRARDGIGNKAMLISEARSRFSLIQDRSVYYCDYFAVRFCYSSSNSFSNTVLSLSKLQKFDRIPFIVCVITPGTNKLFLSNSTLLSKVSHSSQNLTTTNIKGSFNGSDIIKNIDGIENNRDNILRLIAIHSEINFEDNLSRLVEATNNIVPSGHKFQIEEGARTNIFTSVDRAVIFSNSSLYETLKKELDAKVKKYSTEIIVASHIENGNIRGRVIEYLIAGEDEELKSKLAEEINKEYGKLPMFKTKNTLGDYSRIFDQYHTETDIKTKITLLNSNPKAYNIDKFLEFHSLDNTVFFFYFIGTDGSGIYNTILISPYQKNLIDATITLKHWAGRNSRGVTQFEGNVIHKLLQKPNNNIDKSKAYEFLSKLCAL